MTTLAYTLSDSATMTRRNVRRLLRYPSMTLLLVGLPMGVYAGLRPKSAGAKSIMTGSILGFSLPNFWVGLMLIMTFAVVLPDLLPWWPRLPASGRGQTVDVLGVKLSIFTWDGWRHLLLPAVTLALYKGLPVILLIMAVLTLLYGFVTTRTVIGRRIYALGGNRLAAQLSGVKTERLIFFTFANMGALAALAGLVVADGLGPIPVGWWRVGRRVLS